MARYRKIDPRIWRDEKFRRLSLEEKAVAMYVLTSSQMNRIGLFYFSALLAAEEMGMLPETFQERFGNVCQTLFWQWDQGSKTVYLPNWWKYNSPENPNVMKGCLDDLHELPETPFMERFSVNTRYLSGNVCQTFRERFGNVSTQEQEQEQEQEREDDPTLSPEEFQLQQTKKLAREWAAVRIGKPDKVSEVEAMVSGLLVAGVQPQTISDETNRADRDRTEWPREMAKRIRKSAKNSNADVFAEMKKRREDPR